jgi:hypothetical protein
MSMAVIGSGKGKESFAGRMKEINYNVTRKIFIIFLQQLALLITYPPFSRGSLAPYFML